jgi:heat shock protein HtpX
VGLTRYPPGLLSALEKLQSDETEMRPRSSTIAHLWLKRPKTGSRPAPPLDERNETLREL